MHALLHIQWANVMSYLVLQLSQESFPLCMQSIHLALRQQHHLRHWGRMQYGLFLKAIGLSLDEALRFWRAEFTKLMDTDKVKILSYIGNSLVYGKV